jgi:hypothetical protein
MHPDAAGVFGRHIAHVNATPFTKRDIDNYFTMFYNGPQVISIGVDWLNYGIHESKVPEYLRYYSDNNSCLRRTIWEKFPYPDIEYGEDQVWSYQVCLSGYSKVYAHQAVVEHSHDYNKSQTFERAKIEAVFFFRHFGIDVIDPNFTELEIEQLIRNINAVDIRWAREKCLADELINERCRINDSRIKGYLAGIRSYRATQHQQVPASQGNSLYINKISNPL